MSKYNLLDDLYGLHRDYLAPLEVSRQAVDASLFEQLIANFFCPGPFYFYIIDSPTLKFETVSPNAKSMLGVDLSPLSLGDLVEVFHPDDLDFVFKCEHQVADFIKNKITPDKITYYKFSYCVRERISDGTYRLFLIQTITLQTTPEGSLIKVLGIHTDISHITQSNNYKLSFTGLNAEPSYLGIDMLNDKPNINNSTKLLFSNRELEVISLLTQGFTAKEIAEMSNVSTETIITHKKNAIKKAGVKNSVQLVAYCLKKGLI